MRKIQLDTTMQEGDEEFNEEYERLKKKIKLE